MVVEIRLFGPFRDIVGSKQITWAISPSMTVDDLLGELIERYPAFEAHLYKNGTLADRIAITKNKAHIGQLAGVDTMIENGDTIRISPPISGG